MTVLLLSIVGGILAFEVWGSIDLLAKLAIRVMTVPVPEPWRSIRRAELAALIHPCKGDRRVVALLRVILTAGALVIADISHHRFRHLQTLDLPFVLHVADLYQDGMKSDERAPVSLLYIAAMVLVATGIVVPSTVAFVLGIAPWEIALFWIVLLLAVVGLSRLSRGLIIPISVLAYAWAGLILRLALLRYPVASLGRSARHRRRETGPAS